MDKEAQEKIASMIEPFMLNTPGGEECPVTRVHCQFRGDTEACCICVTNEIIKIVRELGYCKLPKDKPPLLSDEEIHKAHFSNRGKYDRDARRAIAEAQREVDIEWYGGKK